MKSLGQIVLTLIAENFNYKNSQNYGPRTFNSFFRWHYISPWFIGFLPVFNTNHGTEGHIYIYKWNPTSLHFLKLHFMTCFCFPEWKTNWLFKFKPYLVSTFGIILIDTARWANNWLFYVIQVLISPIMSHESNQELIESEGRGSM